MPRKKRVYGKRVILDTKFKNMMVMKLINRMMLDGRKTTSAGIVYGAIDYLAEKTGEEGIAAFDKALANIKPPVEVRSRRVGGATYQVPTEVRPERQNSLTLNGLSTSREIEKSIR